MAATIRFLPIPDVHGDEDPTDPGSKSSPSGSAPHLLQGADSCDWMRTGGDQLRHVPGASRLQRHHCVREAGTCWRFEVRRDTLEV